MAYIYIPVTEYEGNAPSDRADQISRELYSLSRPDHVKDPQDATTHFCSVVTHPDGVQVALFVDDQQDVIVHAEHDATTLLDLYGALPSDERTNLSDYIQNNNRFAFANIIPTTLPWITEAEAEVAGWIEDFQE